MKVVLDTNIILASISPFSKYRPVMDGFEQGDFILCLTTDILLEYEEKLAENFNPTVAELFTGGLLLKQNVEFIEVFFHWRLIYPDMDDNKFADCAVAANAHYLVTNDRDFRILKNIEFPKITVLKIEEFMEILEQHS
ncbi:MAG: putative toxin-antitoxin system toxin component, PIN family [Saprospiraceae bacterium]